MLYSHTTSFLCPSIPEVTVTSPFYFWENLNLFLTISFMYIMHCDCIQFSYPLLLLSHLCWLLSCLAVSTPPLPCAGALQEVRVTLCCDCSGLTTILETEFRSTSLPPDCQAYPLFYDWFLDLGWNGRVVFFRVGYLIVTYSQSPVWPVVSPCSNCYLLQRKQNKTKNSLTVAKSSISLWL